MNQIQLAEISNLTIPAATVVYALALLAQCASWAQACKTVRVSVATVEPKLKTAALVGAGADRPSARNAAVDRTVDGDDSDRGDTAVTADYRSAGFARVAITLMVIGALLHAVGVVTRGLAAGRVPWGNMYEFTITCMLAVALTYLALLPKLKLQWLELAMAAVLTAGLGAAMPLYTAAGPLVPALHSYWLVIHVAAVALAGGGFTIGALISITFLLRSRGLARAAAAGRPAPRWTTRVPDGDAMDTLAFKVHAFSFPLWTFGTLIAGPIWALNAWGKAWGWDPKEVWSLIVWLIYAAYLHARVTGGWTGKRAAFIALAGWAAFLFNFIGINLLVSGLHSYAGI